MNRNVLVVEGSDHHQQHKQHNSYRPQGDYDVVAVTTDDDKPKTPTRRPSKRNPAGSRVNRVGLVRQQTPGCDESFDFEVEEKAAPKRRSNKNRPLTRMGTVRQQTGDELMELSLEASRLSLASTCDTISSSDANDFDVTAWLSGGAQDAAEEAS